MDGGADGGPEMLRVTLRGSGVPTVTLGSGETLLFGRSPHGSLPAGDPEAQLRYHALALPQCAAHVSRLVGELAVGDDIVRLRWRGATEAQLSSLFDAPGGARRVTLAKGMSALLDEGENHILVLRGRATGGDDYADIVLSVQVAELPPSDAKAAESDAAQEAGDPADPDGVATGPAPTLARRSREWYVALALCEPWLSGSDDYPRPPSNREVYERVLGWHGYAWNLARPQRVDDALRTIARIAFGPQEDPFASPTTGRAQNVRYAIGRRAAEVRLVTIEDLEEVEREARARDGKR
jgi:hypothetical protein